MSGEKVDQLQPPIKDYQRARRKAMIQEITARFTGSPVGLLSFDEIRKITSALPASISELKDIPLNSIVGSVSRYEDFTRSFYPRRTVNPRRWLKVEDLSFKTRGFPPIDVYQIGEVYFVIDGNHRVSVARQMGMTYIQANVVEVKTRVPVTRETKVDELILLGELNAFLEQTNLDKLRTDSNLRVTAPGGHPKLANRIALHQHALNIREGREISYHEAVTDWYDRDYLPMVRIIHDHNLLNEFPGRTEADLYLWINEHRQELEEEMAGEIDPGLVADHLSELHGARPRRLATRLTGKVSAALAPSRLEKGPPVGAWRKQKAKRKSDQPLITDLLVVINGRPDGWNALDQAIQIAQHEPIHLRGLHILAEEGSEYSQAGSPIQAEFQQRCVQAGVEGKLSLARGDGVRKICDYARWNDLVLITATYQPGTPYKRVSQEMHSLIQHCPRPLLVIPKHASPLRRALLAFNASPKAREALHVAGTIAQRWGTALTVISVFPDGKIPVQAVSEVEQFLQDHGIEAEFIVDEAPVVPSISITIELKEIDLLIMGGYGSSLPFSDSVIDQILPHSPIPLLICR